MSLEVFKSTVTSSEGPVMEHMLVVDGVLLITMLVVGPLLLG